MFSKHLIITSSEYLRAYLCCTIPRVFSMAGDDMIWYCRQITMFTVCANMWMWRSLHTMQTRDFVWFALLIRKHLQNAWMLVNLIYIKQVVGDINHSDNCCSCCRIYMWSMVLLVSALHLFHSVLYLFSVYFLWVVLANANFLWCWLFGIFWCMLFLYATLS